MLVGTSVGENQGHKMVIHAYSIYLHNSMQKNPS